jgi:hypothetical protein
MVATVQERLEETDAQLRMCQHEEEGEESTCIRT